MFFSTFKSTVNKNKNIEATDELPKIIKVDEGWEPARESTWSNDSSVGTKKVGLDVFSTTTDEPRVEPIKQTKEKTNNTHFLLTEVQNYISTKIQRYIST